MQVVNGSLVIIGVNTEQPVVMFNGVKVQGLVGVRVTFTKRVIIKVNAENLNDDVIKNLIDSGVEVRGV